MKGWTIFSHSVRLVFNNLGDALRISLVLYLIQSLGPIIMFFNPPAPVAPDLDDAFPALDPGLMGTSLFLSALGVIASLWIAVAWHRYVLAEEYPTGWLPRWNGTNMAGYLGRSVLIALLIMLAVIIIAIPLSFAGAIFLPVTIGISAYLFFRLGTILPAVALGEKLRLVDAWAATKDQTGPILMLSALVVGGSIVAMLPSLFSQNANSLINLVYSLVVNWFLTIIGISVLTTLYGHYIQKRDID